MDNKKRFDQLEDLLAELLRRADRQDEFNQEVRQRFNGLDDRLDGVINVLKLSAEAHKQSEERQEQMLREIREQGRRTDATQTEILRMMQKWDEQDTHNKTVEERLEATDTHEPRIQRLEDQAFRQAS